MTQSKSAFFAQVMACWNWKCALFSAGARSIVYLAAMARHGAHGGAAVVAVEIVYVTLTSGIFAGLQQRALSIRSRMLGSAIVVLGVPWLAQAFDWLAHRAAGALPPPKATVAVAAYAALSALLHLYAMRSGAFLTGKNSRTLRDDLRQVPKMIVALATFPAALAADWSGRLARKLAAEAAV